MVLFSCLSCQWAKCDLHSGQSKRRELTQLCSVMCTLQLKQNLGAGVGNQSITGLAVASTSVCIDNVVKVFWRWLEGIVVTNEVVFALVLRRSKQTLHNFGRVIGDHSNVTFLAWWHKFVDNALTSVPVVPFFWEMVQIVTEQKMPA